MNAQEFQSLVQHLHTEMLPPHVSGYGHRPLTCELDSKVGFLIDHFLDVSPSEREMIVWTFGPDYSFTFLAYAQRMAELAVRLNDSDMLRRGLAAIAIEGFKYDRRETILVLPLLHHSALKIGADPDALFRRIAELSIPEVKKELIAFLNRDPNDKQIAVMGYREAQTDDGFRYVRDW